MNYRSFWQESAQGPYESPDGALLTTVGLRFREIRGAKRFARISLAKGWTPRVIFARAREMCLRFYSGLPVEDCELMTDIVLSAISCAIADWMATPDPVLTRINDWIDRTVASNQAYITVNAPRG